MEFDLYFQSVEEEVNRKNESMFVLSSDSEDTFWSYAFSKLQKKDISELDVEKHVGITRDFNSFE